MSKITLSGILVAVLASGSLVLATLSSTPGRFVVWGADDSPLVASGAPSGDFLALAAGGSNQTLAIRADRTLYVNPLPVPPTGSTPIPEPVEFAGQEFCAVGTGRSHGLAIRRDNSLVAWPLAARNGAPVAGEFVAVKGLFRYYSVALDTSGNIVVWSGLDSAGPDYDKIVGVGAPTGRFTAIDARVRYILALADDGRLHGWGTDGRPGSVPGSDFPIFTSPTSGWTPDGMGHFIAPMEPGHPYIAIAAGLEVILALRADGVVVQWALDTVDPDEQMPPPPAGVFFTQIAGGGLGMAAGIDDNGGLHVWGTQSWMNAATPGIYSTLSAATSHVAAIEAPKSYLWPPNHKMTTVTLTFRAEDNCEPLALSALSLELRSNQPDNGDGSGHTSGDTNGEDGYSAPVVLPAGAITQNADGSFEATFALRAERSNAWSGPRIYTAAIVSTDTNLPMNASTRIVAQIIVEHGGQ